MSSNTSIGTLHSITLPAWHLCDLVQLRAASPSKERDKGDSGRGEDLAG